MRLDKFITECTELTRSQAKRALILGEVQVNGSLQRDASYKVQPADEVFWQEQRLRLRGQRYIMLHKPEGYICSTVGEVHESVLALLQVDKRQSLHIAGRLDVDTTGLVLITDDGQWSHRVTSPKRLCEKRYQVQLADPLSGDEVAHFAAGIQLHNEDKPCLPARLEVLGTHQAQLWLQEGKYHQVKRMFAALGNRVVALHRDQIGAIRLDPALAPGQWRYLTVEEIAAV